MKKKKKTGKKIGSQKLAKKKSWQNRKKKKLAKNWLAILANFPTSVVMGIFFKIKAKRHCLMFRIKSPSGLEPTSKT